MGSYQPISRIAIIGAGPVGIASAKYLLAENCFERIDIFEQRDRVGGVWNLSGAERSQRLPVPQEDPWYGSRRSLRPSDHDAPDGRLVNGDCNDSLEFESPLYDLLETNIPKPMMQYSDTPFPDHFPLYPSHQETLEYLERYADDVKHLIKFETQVVSVKLLDDGPGPAKGEWEVTTQSLRSDHVISKIYDAVVVASGHYTVPNIVDVPGLAAWNKAYPGSVIHSKAYRRPEAFKDQRVLVVGNSASGTDLAFQIGSLSSHLYLSSKSRSIFSTDGKVSWREDIDEVVEYLSPQDYNRAVKTKSGRIIENLDTVIFATGYFYCFPFLSELEPPLITDGTRTRDTYQHFLHIEYPTLALPVLNIKIIPFGLAENQAAVIARLWSGRLPFPSKEEMRQWEQETFESRGEGKHFHLKIFPEDAAQMNDLYHWAAAAMPRSGLENDGVGKLGMRWDQRRCWMRTIFMNLKLAYNEKGEKRRDIKTIEDLGFSYDDWEKSATNEDMEMLKKAHCFV